MELDYEDINDLTPFEIINIMTLDDVEKFLHSLGVNEISKHEDFLICPTICHNHLSDADNMKLYYYDKNKQFHCYTQCSENFNIFELYRRFMRINYYEINFHEAIEYIKQFININCFFEPKEKISYKTEDTSNLITNYTNLPKYDSHVLSCFIEYYHPSWKKEGISLDSMKKFNILFSINQNKIIIPHYDINSNLIGIRGRALNEDDILIGKYMPIIYNGIIYSHPLGLNLFGINRNKNMIKQVKRAILFESEKSVLLSDTYYGDRSIALATCGSQLNKFQINLLINNLGVNEIIVAFDKEYKNLSDPKNRIYRRKIIEKCSKYRGLANFYYLFDERNLLEEKDSPIDKGKETFEKLLQRKIKI